MKQVNFLGVPAAALKDARFVVLPLPYEQTTSYGKGTARGPKAILDASAQVERYDEELDKETFRRNGIITIHSKQLNFLSGPEKFIPALSAYADNLVSRLSRRQIVIGLGGEHSVTYPLVKAYRRLYPELSVLHFDAHSDLRDEYDGSQYSHACVMRRILGLKPTSIVQVGIRSLTPECNGLMKRRPLTTFKAHSECRKPNLPARVLKALKSKDVFITIDLDAFDPSVIPGVGTPEPGGLGWYQVLDILRLVCRHKNVVGLDVVELMPLKGQTVSEFTAAKLIYRLMGYLG
ncbi:MAG: agmatinase [Candidatus Brocadiia bacterium]